MVGLFCAHSQLIYLGFLTLSIVYVNEMLHGWWDGMSKAAAQFSWKGWSGSCGSLSEQRERLTCQDFTQNCLAHQEDLQHSKWGLVNIRTSKREELATLPRLVTEQSSREVDADQVCQLRIQVEDRHAQESSQTNPHRDKRQKEWRKQEKQQAGHH